jgi:hypothetical protein
MGIIQGRKALMLLQKRHDFGPLGSAVGGRLQGMINQGQTWPSAFAPYRP